MKVLQQISPHDSYNTSSSNFKHAGNMDSDWDDGGDDAELVDIDLASVPNTIAGTLLSCPGVAPFFGLFFHLFPCNNSCL